VEKKCKKTKQGSQHGTIVPASQQRIRTPRCEIHETKKKTTNKTKSMKKTDTYGTDLTESFGEPYRLGWIELEAGQFAFPKSFQR